MTAAISRDLSRPAPIIPARLDPKLTAIPLLDALLAGRFTANGETHGIGDPVDWLANPSGDIEWHIVLHKFYHAPGLVQAYAETGDGRYIAVFKAHLLGWIAAVEPGFIAADVTGRRIQNWVMALGIYTALPLHSVDWDFVAAAERSLTEQADWLAANLHPSRNHRTLELLALLLAGIWLGDEARAQVALELLANNADADFLPDGVHVELSSHYHCIALRNLIDAVALAEANGFAAPERLRTVVTRASHFARVLHKPDGLIPMLSDADTGDYRAMLGVGPPPGKLEVFPDAGYVFLRPRPDQYLVFDCGPLGAGNHGHLDCLSFELAACGRSLIVDPGRYSYHEGGVTNQRAAFRSTGAHNLVQIDGREQTAYRQGPKRMKIAGPEPRATLLEAREGYVRARAVSAEYPVVLDRTIIAGNGGWWLVFDRMEAAEEHDYDLCFQLSPEAQGQTSLGPDGMLHSPNLVIAVAASYATSPCIEQGWVAPAYGIRHAAPRLCVSQRAASGWFAALLIPFEGEEPRIGLETDGHAWCVTCDGSEERGHFR